MTNSDICCSIAPYFRIHKGKLEEFKHLCQRFVGKANGEPGCLYYGFSFDGDLAHCREGYVDADALLVHLKNVGHIIEEALKISDLVRLEVHGPETQLARLREPLAELKAQFFTLEYGFRR